MADFFEQQHHARTQTRTLVFYFMLAVVLIVIAVNVAVWFAGNYGGIFKLSLQQWPYSEYSWLTTAAVLIVILLASTIQSARLGSGGHAVAKMVNARHIKHDSTNTRERVLLNVAEEMSIASGMPMPTVYVMDEESGINAFVAGLKPSVTVLVVTKGCLEKLSRDELQGVIGHEFSHIFNADMKINVRLIGILAGILFIGQMGYFLMRLLGRSRISGGRSRSSKNSGGNILLFILILGATLFAIGYIGLFFGRLIKAGISRQREYLADASSVQFTRNVDGITDALVHIKDDSQRGLLNNSHAEDMSHMCFEMPISLAFGGLLATHPPIEKRVLALKPHYHFKTTSSRVERQSSQQAQDEFSQVSSFQGSIQDSSQNSFHNEAPSFKGATLNQMNEAPENNSDLLMASIGRPGVEHLEAAQNIQAQIPTDIWEDSITSLEKAQLTVYCLLIHAEPEDKEALYAHLKTTLSENKFKQFLNWSERLLQNTQGIRLPLLNHVIPVLKSMDSNEVSVFLKEVLTITKNNKVINLPEYLIYALLKLRLTQQKELSLIRSIFKIQTELEYLFSALVLASHADKEQRKIQYQKMMQQLAFPHATSARLDKFDPVMVHSALIQVARLTPLLKKSIIQTMCDCVLWDNKITIEEYELVRTLCDYLDAPVPALLQS